MAPSITPEPLALAQVARVNEAIAQAEKNTSGEIIAVVAARSSVYWHAPYEAGLWCAGIAVLFATIGSLIVGNGWPYWHVGWYVAITAGGFLSGFFLTRIHHFERHFADESVMRAECEERAHRVFAEHSMFATTHRTGVLVYVSLFEHMVIVLGDPAVSAKLGPSQYTDVVEHMVKHLKDGNLEKGLLEGIEMLGTELSAHFPRAADDVNELPDRLYILS